MPEHQYTHSKEKAHNTTLDDENALQHVKSILVMALCNHPKAFASDFSDNESRHLLALRYHYFCFCLFCRQFESIFSFYSLIYCLV